MEVMPIIHDYITGSLLQRNGVSLDADAALIQEGYLTSLQTVELVMFLEERFGIEIPPEDVNEEQFATLESISSLVTAKLV